jgi:hypothetical protein
MINFEDMKSVVERTNKNIKEKESTPDEQIYDN